MDRATTVKTGRIHLIGVDQPGMPGLAEALAGSGRKVSGSTSTENPAMSWLRDRGVRIDTGHSAHRLALGAQLIVPAPGVDRFHPELLAAIRHGIPRSTRSDLLSWLAQGREVIGVGSDRISGLAGAMIGWVLGLAKLDPTVVLSTRVPQLGGWGSLGEGTHLVCTAGDLPGVRPSILVLLPESRQPTELEADHVFTRHEIAASTNGVVERLSMIRSDAEWWAADIRQTHLKSRFRLFHESDYVTEIWLRLPGIMPVWAAMAATAACLRLGLSLDSIRTGLEEFAGVSRGFECRGSYRGVTLLDDDSADPFEASDAVALARRLHGPRRLWVAVSARLASQAEMTWPADHVMIVGSAEPGLSKLMARSIVVAGREDAIAELDRSLEPGDVLLTLGAGDVGTIADEFIGRLSGDRKAG